MRTLTRGSDHVAQWHDSAVRGPTACCYLADDERQRTYVSSGWNVIGDAGRDMEVYFRYQARTDDMSNAGGCNIAGREVEKVLFEFIEFADALPRMRTGRLQQYRLREERA